MGETLLEDSAMAVSDRPSDRSVESFSEQATIDTNARQHLLASDVSLSELRLRAIRMGVGPSVGPDRKRGRTLARNERGTAIPLHIGRSRANPFKLSGGSLHRLTPLSRVGCDWGGACAVRHRAGRPVGG